MLPLHTYHHCQFLLKHCQQDILVHSSLLHCSGLKSKFLIFTRKCLSCLLLLYIPHMKKIIQHYTPSPQTYFTYHGLCLAIAELRELTREQAEFAGKENKNYRTQLLKWTYCFIINQRYLESRQLFLSLLHRHAMSQSSKHSQT